MPKTKKKQSKKSRLSIFSKFNASSTRAKLLIVVFSFAVIGGGVMVYRSFAATNSLVITGYDFVTVPGNGWQKDIQVNSKSTTRVYEGKTFESHQHKAANDKIKLFVAGNRGKKLKVCADVRFSRGSGDILIMAHNLGHEINRNGVYTIWGENKGVKSSWTSVCSPLVIADTNNISDAAVGVVPSISYTNDDRLIQVRQLVLTATDIPTSTQTPGK